MYVVCFSLNLKTDMKMSRFYKKCNFIVTLYTSIKKAANKRML